MLHDDRNKDDADDEMFGRQFVIDLDLAGETSTVTVYEADVPTFKTSMSHDDVDRLLQFITDFVPVKR